MGRVVSPTPTPLSSGRVVPALVASYEMHGKAVGLFYTQPTGKSIYFGVTGMTRPGESRTGKVGIELWCAAL